jgi:hypothetical protein
VRVIIAKLESAHLRLSEVFLQIVHVPFHRFWISTFSILRISLLLLAYASSTWRRIDALSRSSVSRRRPRSNSTISDISFRKWLSSSINICHLPSSRKNHQEFKENNHFCKFVCIKWTLTKCRAPETQWFRVVLNDSIFNDRSGYIVRATSRRFKCQWDVLSLKLPAAGPRKIPPQKSSLGVV